MKMSSRGKRRERDGMLMGDIEEKKKKKGDKKNRREINVN